MWSSILPTATDALSEIAPAKPTTTASAGQDRRRPLTRIPSGRIRADKRRGDSEVAGWKRVLRPAAAVSEESGVGNEVELRVRIKCRCRGSRRIGSKRAALGRSSRPPSFPALFFYLEPSSELLVPGSVVLSGGLEMDRQLWCCQCSPWANCRAMWTVETS